MSKLIQVRKFIVLLEEILHDGGPLPEKPRRRARSARS